MITLYRTSRGGRIYSEVNIDLSDRRESEPCKVIVGDIDDGEHFLLTVNEAYDLAQTIYTAAYLAHTGGVTGETNETAMETPTDAADSGE